MGLTDEVKQVGGASASVLRTPRAFLRELMMLVRSDPRDYYDFLGDDVLEAQDEGFAKADKPLWLNLGYWKTARTYPEACSDMARKLATAARLGKGDVVVDCGFGFGEQDLLFAREFEVAKILGFNVTELHVNVAKQRVEQRGLAQRIDLQLGSATALPIDAGSVDKVLALECAFHFDTREKFFDEAFRVLKPGGRLATADCMPFVGEHPTGLVNKLVWRRWGVPPANIYDREVYAQKLLARGFVDVEVESIRNHVFPGMHRYSELRKRGVPMDQAKIELSAEDVDTCLGVDVWKRQGGLSDYVIFSARKP